MKERWTALAARIDALSLRERGMLAAALVAVLLGVWSTLVLTPHEARSKQNAQQVQQLEAELVALDAQVQGILARANSDPNAPLRERQQELRDALARLDAAIQAKTGDFIPPERMGRLLEDLLNAQAGLKLLRLESLPPEPVRIDGEAGGEATAVPVYRHGLVLEFAGDYRGTLEFLQAVEKLPWRVFWEALDYEVQQYPQARVRLILRTLSGREDWIRV